MCHLVGLAGGARGPKAWAEDRNPAKSCFRQGLRVLAVFQKYETRIKATNPG